MDLLGSISLRSTLFSPFEQQFQTDEFLQLSQRKRFRKVNEVLLDLIRKNTEEAFLLPAVVAYIQRINALKILKEHYHISLFEFWLNHYSEVSEEENYRVRAQIVGKYLPRVAYQPFFPIGMGHKFPGTHYVVAHISPDIDTTIASFWGWVDAFAARVGDGVHLWALPGGPPDSPIIQIFQEAFGTGVFDALCRTSASLTLRSMDLVTSANFIKMPPETQVSSLDHGFNEKAVILVDAQGHYLGDWRSTDVEPVRQIIVLFKACMRWFETNVHTLLIELFSNPLVQSRDILKTVDAIFDKKIGDCEPVRDFTDQQNRDLEALFQHIFKLEKGLQATFQDLNQAFQKLSVSDFDAFRKELQALGNSEIFDQEKKLIENRPPLFQHLHRVFSSLEKAIHQARDYVERLDVSMQIKSDVVGKTLHFLTIRSDVDDIALKMGNYSYLTVVIPEESGSYYPVGVVWAKDLRQQTLGTVSLRDFSNFEEVKMAPYLAVISVIDHHKSSLKTMSPPTATLGDAQSCNVLVAEMSMELNQPVSLKGMSPHAIVEQLKNPPSTRIAQRLLLRKIAAETKGNYYVHPQRESLESFFFLQAILDDTDLLTKVTARDVECVAELLNTLKTLTVGRETEIIDLSTLPKDPQFAKKAAQLILSHPDMYSLYHKVYASKENEVEEVLKACVEGHPSSFFTDTKEQNGCCRVGQAKLFTRNHPHFETQRKILQKMWLEKAQAIHARHPALDLHMQMISTIASADEVFKGEVGKYAHRDELWIWIPNTPQAQDHLASFLSAFQHLQLLQEISLELQLPREDPSDLQGVFTRNFFPLPIKKDGELPLAVLSYAAGALNSRKALISPYLPRV